MSMPSGQMLHLLDAKRAELGDAKADARYRALGYDEPLPAVFEGLQIPDCLKKARHEDTREQWVVQDATAVINIAHNTDKYIGYRVTPLISCSAFVYIYRDADQNVKRMVVNHAGSSLLSETRLNTPAALQKYEDTRCPEDCALEDTLVLIGSPFERLDVNVQYREQLKLLRAQGIKAENICIVLSTAVFLVSNTLKFGFIPRKRQVASKTDVIAATVIKKR